MNVEKLKQGFLHDLHFYQITNKNIYLKCAKHILNKIKTEDTTLYLELKAHLKNK